MTLYELTNDYMNLLELAEDPDIDEQAFMDTLEGIEGALEETADVEEDLPFVTPDEGGDSV